MKWITELEQRFGSHRVRKDVNPLHPEQPLVFLYLEQRVPVTVVMTCGLSEYEMPVMEKWKGREFNELFFCLPAYWELDNLENENFNWVYSWIFRLEKFVREKNTWYGPGHTIPAGNPPTALSSTMKEEYFIFMDPIFLEYELQPAIFEEKTVYFLSIVPIFPDELDYKMGKGTYKLIQKFRHRNFDERLDDYRVTFLKSRFRLF